jgi:hypothetical protein
VKVKYSGFESANAKVTWRVELAVVATPAALSFGVLAARSTAIERRLIVRATDGSPIRVLRIDADASHGASIALSETSPEHQASLHPITVRLTTNAPESERIGGDIHIVTEKNGDQSDLVVPWSALVRIPAE